MGKGTRAGRWRKGRKGGRLQVTGRVREGEGEGEEGEGEGRLGRGRGGKGRVRGMRRKVRAVGRGADRGRREGGGGWMMRGKEN